MTSQLTEIALQMLGTIERMELIIPEITDTIRKALEEKAALTKPVPSADGEVADPVIPGEYAGYLAAAYRNGFHAGHKHALTCAALAPQPVPEGPTDEHILRLAREWNSGYESIEFEFISDFARAVLDCWGQP